MNLARTSSPISVEELVVWLMVGEGCEMKGFGEECSVEERGRRWFGEGRNGCVVIRVPAIHLVDFAIWYFGHASRL